MSASKSSAALLPPGVAEDEPPFDLDLVHREHGHWLLSFLRRRFGLEAAEDLAQETYVRAASAKAAIRNPRAFLAKVALNAARNQARARAARPRLVSDHGAQGAQAADQAERLILKETILALPPKLRDVFLLSRYAGLTYAEIAARRGLSVKTVEDRMSKALKICTARMRD